GRQHELVPDQVLRSEPAWQPLSCTVTGTPGDDTLAGTGAADVICALSGDDTISDLGPNDLVVGGPGSDTLDFSNGPAVEVDLVLDSATVPGAVEIWSTENVIGSSQSDSIRGNAAPNVIAGGDGNDHLAGGSGRDTLSFADAASGVGVDLSAGTASGQGADDFVGFENVTGSARSDVISGNDLPNTLVGGDGNDTLLGLGGDDSIQGGPGSDTVNFSQATRPQGVDVNLSAGRASGEGADRLTGIENVVGSPQGDAIVGNVANNLLSGSGGDDVLSGLAGNDTFSGGAGTDTASFSAAGKAGVNADLVDGKAVGEGRDDLE